MLNLSLIIAIGTYCVGLDIMMAFFYAPSWKLGLGSPRKKRGGLNPLRKEERRPLIQKEREQKSLKE